MGVEGIAKLLTGMRECCAILRRLSGGAGREESWTYNRITHAKARIVQAVRSHLSVVRGVGWFVLVAGRVDDGNTEGLVYKKFWYKSITPIQAQEIFLPAPGESNPESFGMRACCRSLAQLRYECFCNVVR